VGDIAEGGGDFNVVSEVEVEFTVLFVTDSVLIGGFSIGSVVCVVCAYPTADNIKYNTNEKIIFVNFI